MKKSKRRGGGGGGVKPHLDFSPKKHQYLRRPASLMLGWTNAKTTSPYPYPCSLVAQLLATCHKHTQRDKALHGHFYCHLGNLNEAERGDAMMHIRLISMNPLTVILTLDKAGNNIPWYTLIEEHMLMFWVKLFCPAESAVLTRKHWYESSNH